MVLTFYSKKAFTLVELLVVIAIIGLLSTIVLISTSGLREQAEIAKTLTWARSIDSTLGADAVGIWNMDENPASQGTVIKDMSGWGNDGTLSTGETGVNKSVAGVVGQAISFDGVDDYIDLPSSAILRLGNEGTIAIWVKANSFSQDYNIMYTSTGGADIDKAPYIYCSPDGKLNAYLGGAARQGIPSDIYLSIGQWYLVLFTWDGSNVSLYANMDYYTIPQTVINQFTGNFRIGRYNPVTPERIWDGLIDEVRIYNQALTASQIQSQYYAGLNKLLAKGLIDEIEYQERLVLK
jgi:prepilin-type N-terminal cleavage/methylation domain-containing protein